jgi:hypothetical protein
MLEEHLTMPQIMVAEEAVEPVQQAEMQLLQQQEMAGMA